MKKQYLGALIFGLLFAAEIALLKRFDVAAIGPGGTEVGFSHLNQKVHEMTGVNLLWYDITDWIGYGAIGVCLIFAIVGLVQLIKRRSLAAVDREILALGGLFLVTIGCYVLFEKFIVNYRPVIMPGETEPEASFPSSHTVLIVVVMAAVMMIIGSYVNDLFTGLIKALCVIVLVVTVAGRLYSGVHWLTDITGGLLLSTTLLFVFGGVISGGGKAAEAFGDSTDFSAFEDKKTGGKSTAGYTPKH